MTMELYIVGEKEPERVISISNKKKAAETRKKWINDVKNLPNKYYLIIKNTGQ